MLTVKVSNCKVDKDFAKTLRKATLRGREILVACLLHAEPIGVRLRILS